MALLQFATVGLTSYFSDSFHPTTWDRGPPWDLGELWSCLMGVCKGQSVIFILARWMPGCTQRVHCAYTTIGATTKMRQICMRDKIRDASKVLLVISEIFRRSTEIWAVDPIREERFFREGCKASQKTPKLKSDCAIALGTGAIHVLLEPNPLDRFHHGRYWHCSGLGCILKGARCEVQVRLEFGNIQQNASKMCLQLKIISKTHPIFL